MEASPSRDNLMFSQDEIIPNIAGNLLESVNELRALHSEVATLRPRIIRMKQLRALRDRHLAHEDIFRLYQTRTTKAEYKLYFEYLSKKRRLLNQAKEIATYAKDLSRTIGEVEMLEVASYHSDIQVESGSVEQDEV
ncbi:hypothetical protein CC2G_002202 [Coprinopsis cinerea AmutBmut pab1-1]|nr:hypothetical protein CC2G_002202 [Coprinopsis cinerea AmutBmut pab1-1]